MKPSDAGEGSYTILIKSTSLPSSSSIVFFGLFTRFGPGSACSAVYQETGKAKGAKISNSRTANLKNANKQLRQVSEFRGEAQEDQNLPEGEGNVPHTRPKLPLLELG